MGIFDKIKGMVSTDDLDYNEYEGDLFADDAPEQDAQAQASGSQNQGYENSKNFGGYDQPQQAQGQSSYQSQQPKSAPSSSLELKVVKPDRYENVNQIADHLLNRRTVVLNLEGTNKETARRLIDFLSGVAYSISGQLKRVANNTFVITPQNVDVSGDQLRGPEPKQQPQQDSSDFYNDEL